MDPAILRADETALLVLPDDYRGLATAMIKLYRSRTLRSSLARQGRATAESFGDLDREICRAERLYLELLNHV
jgi:hypothetical protein